MPTPSIAQTSRSAAARSSVKQNRPQATKVPTPSSIVAAKQAYRAGQISKERYREIVNHLESEFDMRVRQTKFDYKEGRISKETHRQRIIELKRRYIGES